MNLSALAPWIGGALTFGIWFFTYAPIPPLAQWGEESATRSLALLASLIGVALGKFFPRAQAARVDLIVVLIFSGFFLRVGVQLLLLLRQQPAGNGWKT